MVDNPLWSNKAACKDMPEYKFDLASVHDKFYIESKSTCDSCPVKRDCLEYSMEVEGTALHRAMMYGGQLPSERKSARRKINSPFRDYTLEDYLNEKTSSSPSFSDDG